MIFRKINGKYQYVASIPNGARGALLDNQEMSNILIDNLNNNDTISKFKFKSTDKLKELFIDKYGKSKLETF